MEGGTLVNQDKENEQFKLETEMLGHNIQKISLINKIFTIIIVSLFLMITILSSIPSANFDKPLSVSFLQYILLLLFNLSFIYLLDIRKIQVTNKNHKKISFLVNFYVTFFLVIAALISIRDQDIYNPLLIYTLILFTCSAFLVLNSSQILIPIIISSCILLIGFYVPDGTNAVYNLQLIYIFTLLPIVYFISRSFYYSFERSFKSKLELIKETHHSRNLTELLKEANRQLEYQASIDPLTNLYNRRAYNNYVNKLQIKSLESPYSLSVIMIDVDCFKLYNDTYGHAEGDNALKKIGQVLFEIGVQYDCFATRWGGEEFSVLLSEESEEIVEQICYKIRNEVKNLKIYHSSSTISSIVTVSIGASTKYISDPDEILTCINEADSALYFVKENGRNNYEHRIGVHVL